MATTLQPDAGTAPVRQAAAAEKTARWTLNRAGIINVYQYDNETLHFGGGRLLLRGVNGSGKSTAMNMLLPFLLDGDARRIDAAGEQYGVLRSWMLSGREEAQPVGYLWLEVARGDEHVSFGCGIRANRSTDQVTTWWFVTARRPGIDFHLVEGRVPVSRDALKTLIEPDPVFRHDERAQYRTELRKRLFGGADIEQHLHLLRIVRNPRVGDRLDAELPQYLQDALPQLSDAALDDAAQPLEDLEEHRRNVAELERTAETLDAIHRSYRNYARTELHRMADGTHEAARRSRERHRDEEKAGAAHEQALERRRDVDARKHALEREAQSLRGAIAALEASEAYKSGAQLNDLRDYVESLTHAKASADDRLSRRRKATERAARAVLAARQETAAEHDALRERTADLASLASGCGLTARPTAPPSIAPDPDSPAGVELAPSESIETEAAEQALEALRAAARERAEEVASVEAAVRAIEPAERALRDAEERARSAESAREDAAGALREARTGFQTAIEGWQAAAASWLARMRAHHAEHALAQVETPPEIDGVVDEIVLGRPVGRTLEALTEPAIRHHATREARLEAALSQQEEIVAELEARAAELAARTLPDPPALDWQQRRGRCLAELVDFAEHVPPETRARLEAALEASGLLAAEVSADGALRLADGQLVIAPGAAAAVSPLGALLRADVPDEGADESLRETVDRILASISTDPAAGADTVVTVDGEFRLGAARGRHVKAEAEHIGLTARRAALERQRAENARALEQAESERARIAADVESARAALNDALVLRAEVPSDQPLREALWRRSEAERAFEQAEEALHARRAELESAEQRHAEAVSEARATASRLSLPMGLDELRGIGADLERIAQESRTARSELARLAGAVGRWWERGEDWRAAREEEARSEADLAAVAAQLDSARGRLATLEQTIGAAYEEVVERIRTKREAAERADEALRGVENEREQSVKDVTAAEKDRERAAAERERADEECIRTLGVLKAALEVPGLLDAAAAPTNPEGGRGGGGAGAAEPEGVASNEPGASDPSDEREHSEASGQSGTSDALVAQRNAALPPVEDTPAGARRLVSAIRAQVPRAQTEITAEGVRQSIRQRRDSLGAGWDADGMQPDDRLPLHVEVTGPLAHQKPLPAASEMVHGQLATMRSLLSAKQDQALRNLLQGLVAREVADKLHAAGELIERMNKRLSAITTSHGIGVSLRWSRRDDLDPELAGTIDLLAKPPDLRTADEDAKLSAALGRRIDDAHREDPGTPYRELIARVLDYRDWHRLAILLHRAGRSPERLGRRTALSEGEKKIVSYLPLFAAVAASCDALADSAPDALRFVLLDDAFAKVSEDNHAKLFGLLVELDLDFIATSERLWGTHETVPELAITEVIRDADLATIVLEHSHWNAERGELH